MTKGFFMDNKCDKYQALFVFADEDDFQNHLMECETCRKEHRKFLKVSSMVKEVRMEYLKRERSSNIKKIASCYLFLAVTLTGIIGLGLNSYLSENLGYSSNSVIYNQGLPVDDYGLLKI